MKIDKISTICYIEHGPDVPEVIGAERRRQG